MVDYNEREGIIDAAAANYIAGDWSRIRCEPVLRSCGLNATQIEEFFTEHRDTAFASMMARGKKFG